MRNHLKINFGKYLDGLTEELPQTDIILSESGVFSHELEAGEPNVPTIDSTNVTLRNLDENNVEQYGYDAFWEAEARTSGEGGTFPLELYFRAKIKDTTVFTGVLNGVDYDRYKETCSVVISDFLRAFKDDKRVMFKPFKFTGTVFLLSNSDSAITSLTAADGVTALGFEKITVLAETTIAVISSPTFLTMSGVLANHIDANALIFAGGSGFGNKFTDFRNAFVQIGDITMFTKIKITLDLVNLGGLTPYQYYLYIDIFHMDNTASGVYSAGGKNVIEPCRYFNNDGSVIVLSDNITVTLWDWDAYTNDPDILVQTADMPSTVPFIAGCSAVDTAGAWVLDETVSGATFDVLTKLQTVLDREISAQFFDTIGADTLFDFSEVDPDLYRSCFWADAIIHGWLGATASDVIRNALAQTSCYATADVNGVIKFIPRYGFSATLASGSYPTGTTVLQPENFEPLDRVRYDRGYMAVEIETPTEIIPVVNVKSNVSLKTKVNENGVVTSSKIRINSFPVRSYRTYDTLQFPLQEDIDVFGMPLLRGEPATLTDYASTAIDQAERYMEGKFYPRRNASIAVNFEDYPLELGDFVAIENSPDTDYNGCWQIVSITYDATQPEILSKLALEFRGSEINLMSYVGKFYSFLDVSVTLTFPDASTSTFTIEAPNARNPFKWAWNAISGRQTYRDGNYELQRRRELYQFIAELSYNFHRMEIVDIFRASRIELKIPIWWGPATFYIPFDCILDRSDVTNEAFGGIMGGKISDYASQAGIIPRTGTTLRFIGVDTFAWDEIGSETYPMLPPITPIAIDGFDETPLIGLKVISAAPGAVVLQEINASSPSLPPGTETVRIEGVNYDVMDVTILPFST